MKQFYKYSLAATFAATMLCTPMSTFAQEQEDAAVATFEDLNLDVDKYWCGPADNAVEVDGAWGSKVRLGSFKSGAYEFVNSYTPAWASWTGCSYSSMTSTSFASYATDQWNSAVGHGADNSATYGVIYGSSTPNEQMEVVKVTDAPEGKVIKGMNITNSAWTVECVKKGNGTAKKFEQGDWFKVTFTGVKADKSTASVDYYLADYRSEDEANWKVLTDWDWIDLSSLGKVVTLNVSFDGSDAGAYGLNTSVYVCVDNVGCAKNIHTGIAHLGNGNMVEVYEVARFTVDGKRISAPQKGINIVRMSDGTTRKVVVK